MKLFFILLISILPATIIAQDDINKTVEQSTAQLDRLTQKCNARTQKALRRMKRYEEKLMAKAQKDSKSVLPDSTALNVGSLSEKVPSGAGNVSDLQSVKGKSSNLVNEPILDSLNLACRFLQKTKDVPKEVSQTGIRSVDKARQQLNVAQDVKSQLYQRKDMWKSELKKHPEYKKWVGKLEKESYYYTAQINQYRKAFCDPSQLEDKLMQTLRKNPQWSSFLASLPAKPQDPEKMQTKDMVKQMMQSQAASIDPDVQKVLKDAKTKGSEVLETLSGSEAGNIDNASQIPSFSPNPYKTKSFWDCMDFGFDLEFDRKTYHLPSSGQAGVQAVYNISKRFSTGLLANYRFGLGEDIKHIRFSNLGMGYGTFFNGKVWKNFGAQVGYERNYRVTIETAEGNNFPAEWSQSLLLGVTWEYKIGKKAKGTLGVFYDFLYNKHTPETNAFLWRMGWKF